MDLEEYRIQGKAMVDFIADYLSTVGRRRVFPDVKPGYMRPLLPDSAPEEGESFKTILDDFEKVVMPGITHWQSPQMHAYFPALNSPASLLGDMLADGLGCLAFTWASSPACTELEIIVMDWLAKLLDLPGLFLHSASRGKGGGVIQTTASESTLIGLLAARTQMFQHYRESHDEIDEADLNTRLVGYTSDQAHSSVEKAGLIGLVKMRYLESDTDLSLRGEALMAAIRTDREKGLIPFFVCATLGTTGACAFDHLKEIGIICERENIWLHVDAAYAGSAFICPEFRHWLDGIEYADSFAFNPSKWLLVHFDCTAMWVKNSERLHRTFNVDPLYLKHENTGNSENWPDIIPIHRLGILNVPTYFRRNQESDVCVRHCTGSTESINAIDSIKVKTGKNPSHWQISLSKRFRALKLWFVLRNYGMKGLQQHIRHGVNLAKAFETLVVDDDRFEIPAKRHLGLVVFRIKGENELTESLLKKINSSGKLHCVPSSLKGKYVIRFTVTSPRTTYKDIQNDWAFIQMICSQILNESPSGKRPLSIAEIKRRNPSFGTSLLLSNSPMTPKVMNGSFVAIFEAGEVLREYMDRNGTLRIACKDSPVLQRRLKGLIRGQRQFSLDSHIDLMVAANSAKEKSAGKGPEQSLVEVNESSSEDITRCDKCGQVIPF